MIDHHLMKLRARDAISAEEEAAIVAMVSEVREMRADRHMVRAYQPLSESNILISGVACRYKDLRNGGRQITQLHVAGDALDLHSFTLKYLDHDVLALSDCTYAVIPHDRIAATTKQFPRLMRVYWFSTNLDAAIHREWELSLGRRTALAALAHLFCEMEVRLGIVGLAANGTYQLPMTQTDLAECLGLTAVHVNRTLQELRGTGLVEFRGGEVQILDSARLRAVAEFNPGYLYLDRPGRE